MEDFEGIGIAVPEYRLPATSSTGTPICTALMELKPNTLYGVNFEPTESMPNDLAHWLIRPSKPLTEEEYKSFYGPVYVRLKYTPVWQLTSQGNNYGFERGQVFHYITLGHDNPESMFVLGHETKLMEQGTPAWDRPPIFFKIDGVTRQTLPREITPNTPGIKLDMADVPYVPFQTCVPFEITGALPGTVKF